MLEAANDLFRNIMSRQLGEMDYTDQEALYPGGTFPEGEGYETEYHVLDFTQDPALTQDKQNRAQLEARFVAREIAGLLREGFPVSDGHGGTRPLQPEDVAILLRSPGPVRSYYTQALEEAGVAWSAEEGGDLFATTEVSVALSWLQIIDNPHQDIPLLAVLRSPLVGMTGDRLAAIRTLRRGTFTPPSRPPESRDGGTARPFWTSWQTSALARGSRRATSCCGPFTGARTCSPSSPLCLGGRSGGRISSPFPSWPGGLRGPGTRASLGSSSI